MAAIGFATYLFDGQSSRCNKKREATMTDYCSRCNKPGELYDEVNTWCPSCKSYVDAPFFVVPGWIMGTLVLLMTVAIRPY